MEMAIPSFVILINMVDVRARPRSYGFRPYSELLRTLQPSDLIEFFRGTYMHWAMYAGDGKVINICAEDKGHSEAEIKLQSLRHVCELDPDPGHQLVRVNNFQGVREAGFLASRNLRARRPDAALAAARAMLNITVPYDFLGRNCEYYCTLWKFGEGISFQVRDGVQAIYAVGQGPTWCSIL